MNGLSGELFERNGISGQTYRISRRGEQGMDMGLLDDVRFYAVARGHVAVAGGLERKTEGDIGWLKLIPELTPDEKQEIADAGLSAEPLLH